MTTIHNVKQIIIGGFIAGGVALAATIPDATFLGFEGMGHDLPETLWPTIADRVIELAAR